MEPGKYCTAHSDRTSGYAAFRVGPCAPLCCPTSGTSMKSGFYKPYFIVPKKGSGLRQILDLHVLNRALHKLPFKMLTQRRIFQCIRPFDWSAATDLKDPYFHVSILPRHRQFLHFAFEGRAYQWALPFGLSLSPRVFTKVVEAALVPLREASICFLNYLNIWLILALSRALLCEHRDMVLSHLSRLGLQVNWEPPRRSTSPCVTCTPSPPLESEASEVASRCSCPRRAQSCRRRALTSARPSGRMTTPPRGSQADFEMLWGSSGRPVCLPGHVPQPAVLLPVRGDPRHRCAGTQLASGPTQICVSPSEPSRTDPVQGQRG